MTMQLRYGESLNPSVVQIQFPDNRAFDIINNVLAAEHTPERVGFLNLIGWSSASNSWASLFIQPYGVFMVFQDQPAAKFPVRDLAPYELWVQTHSDFLSA